MPAKDMDCLSNYVICKIFWVSDLSEVGESYEPLLQKNAHMDTKVQARAGVQFSEDSCALKVHGVSLQGT